MTFVQELLDPTELTKRCIITHVHLVVPSSFTRQISFRAKVLPGVDKFLKAAIISDEFGRKENKHLCYDGADYRSVNGLKL